MANAPEFLSTGQAAKEFSVTPDTVLKWIKAGKITATRTPGGHYRIPREELIAQRERNKQEVQRVKQAPAFQYCWQFKSKGGKILDGCLECIIYKTRAKRCYEITKMPGIVGHSRLFCDESCEQCEYYHIVHDQKYNVLIVTENTHLRSGIERHAHEVSYNIAFTDCEYQCSMMIESFRPDFVVLDCGMGVRRSREFARHLAEDPRIPFVKIILAGERYELPEECDREVFAFIHSSFTAHELERLIDNLNQS